MQKNEKTKLTFAVNRLVQVGPEGRRVLYVRIPKQLHHRVKRNGVYKVTLERID